MRFLKRRQYRVGEQRARGVFAWLPTSIGIYWVWLERFGVEEKLCEVEQNDPYPTTYYSWVPVRKWLV